MIKVNKKMQTAYKYEKMCTLHTHIYLFIYD